VTNFAFKYFYKNAIILNSNKFCQILIKISERTYMPPLKPFNIYGDKFIPTTGCHGTNISQQRIDKLDISCLSFIEDSLSAGASIQAIDLGGGAGAQSKRMARLGANVVLIDLSQTNAEIEAFNIEEKLGKITLLKRDARHIPDEDLPVKIDCFYSQRMINYIPYHDALSLLCRFKKKSGVKAKFFISSGGIETEYGQTYLEKDKPIAQRFGSLSEEMSTKHGINTPVCLYREQELCDLLEKAGLKILDSWTSIFGNPKIIAQV